MRSCGLNIAKLSTCLMGSHGKLMMPWIKTIRIAHLLFLLIPKGCLIIKPDKDPSENCTLNRTQADVLQLQASSQQSGAVYHLEASYSKSWDKRLIFPSVSAVRRDFLCWPHPVQPAQTFSFFFNCTVCVFVCFFSLDFFSFNFISFFRVLFAIKHRCSWM